MRTSFLLKTWYLNQRDFCPESLLEIFRARSLGSFSIGGDRKKTHGESLHFWEKAISQTWWCKQSKDLVWSVYLDSCNAIANSPESWAIPASYSSATNPHLTMLWILVFSLWLKKTLGTFKRTSCHFFFHKIYLGYHLFNLPKMTNELTVSLFKLNIIQMKMLTSSGCRCLYSNLEEQQQHQVPTLTRAIVSVLFFEGRESFTPHNGSGSEHNWYS